MRLEAEEVDMVFLDEAFNLPTLCNLHTDICDIIDTMTRMQGEAMYYKDTATAVDLEIKMQYLEANLDRIEVVMASKESDILVFTGIETYCLN